MAAPPESTIQEQLERLIHDTNLLLIDFQQRVSVPMKTLTRQPTGATVSKNITDVMGCFSTAATSIESLLNPNPPRAPITEDSSLLECEFVSNAYSATLKKVMASITRDDCKRFRPIKLQDTLAAVQARFQTISGMIRRKTTVSGGANKKRSTRRSRKIKKTRASRYR